MSPLMYRLASRLHWAPRERAVMAAIRRIADMSEHPPVRVIDLGCGPGLLAAPVRALSLAYAGIDPSSRFIEHCRAAHGTDGSFLVGSVQSWPLAVGMEDVLVLNGVVHHLDDAAWALVLDRARDCAALILCDHLRIDGRTGRLARWLQDADRGKHVRAFQAFEALPGYSCRHREFFDIGIGPLPLWPYFCAAYIPE